MNIDEFTLLTELSTFREENLRIGDHFAAEGSSNFQNTTIQTRNISRVTPHGSVTQGIF